MKNSVLSLFKKKNSSNNASNSGESDDATLSPSTSQNSLNNGNSGSPHSGSFSNLSDLLQQNGSLVYNSLPETTLSYGHIQTPFNLFELNRRMYQTNSQVLLQKQANANSNNGSTANGGNRMSLSNQQATAQPIALTPSLLMGKRKELNRVSTQSPTADITPRSSSPSITTTSTPTTTNSTTTNNNTSAAAANNTNNTNGNSSATPSTPTPTSNSTESTTPTIKTVDSSPTVKTTTTSAVSVVNSNIIKTALSDQDKLIGLISSYLIPHKDHLKSRESLSSQQFLSILLLNKKWNSIVLANDLPSIHDDIVKLWAILVEEMYEPAANIENDHMSKKFIELCKFLLNTLDI